MHAFSVLPNHTAIEHSRLLFRQRSSFPWEPFPPELARAGRSIETPNLDWTGEFFSPFPKRILPEQGPLLSRWAFWVILYAFQEDCMLVWVWGSLPSEGRIENKGFAIIVVLYYFVFYRDREHRNSRSSMEAFSCIRTYQYSRNPFGKVSRIFLNFKLFEISNIWKFKYSQRKMSQRRRALMI